MELKADTTRRYQGEPIAAYDDLVKRFATDASSTTLHLQKTTKFLNLKMEESATYENCIFEFDNNLESGEEIDRPKGGYEEFITDEAWQNSAIRFLARPGKKYQDAKG